MSMFPQRERLVDGSLVHELSAQAMRDYQRQRQMTLGDLLLENRVIFLQG